MCVHGVCVCVSIVRVCLCRGNDIALARVKLGGMGGGQINRPNNGEITIYQERKRESVCV